MVFLYRSITQCIYHFPVGGDFVCFHLTFIKLLQISGTSTLVDICFHFSCVYLGVLLLGSGVIISLTLWDITKLFSTAVVPFHSCISNIWEFQVLHIIDNSGIDNLLILTISMGMKWYFITVLVSLMTKYVGHYLYAYWTIYMSSFMNYWFTSFAI